MATLKYWDDCAKEVSFACLTAKFEPPPPPPRRRLSKLLLGAFPREESRVTAFRGFAAFSLRNRTTRAKHLGYFGGRGSESSLLEVPNEALS